MRRTRVDVGLDALTWVVVLVMIAPIVWLLLSATQTNLQIANGTYDFLSPTFEAFSEMWETVDFERYFINSLIICSVAALVATALTEQQAETIPIGIRNFIGNYQQRTAQLMAAGVVSTLPVLLAFLATQRWLVKGLTAGAVKG